MPRENGRAAWGVASGDTTRSRKVNGGRTGKARLGPGAQPGGRPGRGGPVPSSRRSDAGALTEPRVERSRADNEAPVGL